MFSLNSDNLSCSTMEYPRLNATAKAVHQKDIRICLVLRGSAVWSIDGQEFTVKKGNVVILTAHQKRNFTKILSPDFKIFIINLKRQCFYGNNYLSFVSQRALNHRFGFENAELSEILADFYKEYVEQSPDRYELFSAYLTEFFVKSQRLERFDASSFRKMDKRMLKVLDFLDQSFTSPISLHEVALNFNMTDSSFSRWFSDLNGVTFKKHLMAKRVEHAVMLLETTDLTVTAIAFECGFSGTSGFYDAFKKMTGTTPHKIIRTAKEI